MYQDQSSKVETSAYRIDRSFNFGKAVGKKKRKRCLYLFNLETSWKYFEICSPRFVFLLHHTSQGTQRVMSCHFDASLHSNGRNQPGELS